MPGMAAKPIIEMLMEVADCSDEPAYVTPLEGHGYELRIRELLVGGSTGCSWAPILM